MQHVYFIFSFTAGVAENSWGERSFYIWGEVLPQKVPG